MKWVVLLEWSAVELRCLSATGVRHVVVCLMCSTVIGCWMGWAGKVAVSRSSYGVTGILCVLYGTWHARAILYLFSIGCALTSTIAAVAISTKLKVVPAASTLQLALVNPEVEAP